MPLGFSYQPGQADTIPMSGSIGGQGGTAPQSPAKILSLRLPKNLGQSPVAARQLLSSPGAGGDLNAIIMALMRSVQPPMNGMGQINQRPPQGSQDAFHAQSGQLSPLSGAGSLFPSGGGGFGQAPPPRVTIGDEDRLGAAPEPQLNYGSPWAPGVTPMPGEGDAAHNPFFYDGAPEKMGLFD